MIKLDTAKSKLAMLASSLTVFTDDIAEAPSRLALKGKTLEEANKEQASWYVRYYQLKADADKKCKLALSIVEAVRAVYVQKYTENYSRELTERTKDKYVDGEEDVIMCHELYLECKQVHDELTGICEAFTARGYALRNITDLRIHQMEHNLL